MGNRIWRESVVNGVAAGRKYIVDISGELPTILCEIEDPNSFVPSSLKKSYYYADGQILSQRVHDPNDPNSYTPYFYVHDRLGSVRMVVDDTGAAVCSYTYRPYGAFYEGESGPSGFDNPWKYTGQWYDAEIRQYYLRARQYDPTMMRFTSKDPVAGSYEESLTLHKYLYCLNNPINRVDRSGRISLGALSAITTGTALYAQGIELAAYAADTGNWKFFDLSFATMEFIPVAMSIAAIRGGTHGLDVFARALQMKTLRNRYIRGLIQDWLIGEGVEALSPTGLSFVQGLAIDSTAYYLYSALLFGVRSYNGTSADEMADYAEWKGGI